MTAPPALDLADTFAGTPIWLADLATYEEHINEQRRMTLYSIVARKVDRETGEVTQDADAAAAAAWAAFVATLTPWLARAGEARAMVALLDDALDRLEALPTADCAGWARGCGLYLRLRYRVGGSVRPLPPGLPWSAWPCDVSLATWRTDAQRDHWWPCRHRYLLLARPGKHAAREEYGIGEVSDLLHTIYPIAEQHALDRRAGTMCVDTRVRLDLEDRYFQAAEAKKRRR